jgi:FG-GAP repeat/FG-GAP-like repeat
MRGALSSTCGLSALLLALSPVASAGCTAIIGLPDLPAPPDADRSRSGDASIDARSAHEAASVNDDAQDVPDATVQDGTRSDGPSRDAPASHDAATEAEAGRATALPELLSPLSTSRVTRTRPTLRWRVPPSATSSKLFVHQGSRGGTLTSVTVTPASDGACSYASTTFTPGVYFWSVSVPVDSGDVTSEIWEFTVGKSTSATVDSSSGTMLDVNGDGYADLAVGAPASDEYTGSVAVYLGGPGGLGTSPATVLLGPALGDGYFGTAVASAGDVNGDGYADLIVGAPDVAEGKAYVYYGGSNGLDVSSFTTLAGPSTSTMFGQSVASAGDVNGDGYADIIVGAPNPTTMSGGAYVFFGGMGGVATSPASSILGMGTSFGHSVAGVGDVNGDGYGDILVGVSGTTSAPSSTGGAFLFLGGAGGIVPSAGISLPSPSGFGSAFGGQVAPAGDVNGDGLSDFLVGAEYVDAGAGRVYIYEGSLDGGSGRPATTLLGPLVGGHFGRALASAGDVNGDGFADVVIGAPSGQTATSTSEGVYVYLGHATGVGVDAAAAISTPDASNVRYGSAVASGGNLAGGTSDYVVVGAFLAHGTVGSVDLYKYVGGALVDAGVVPPPDGSLNFGTAVFGQTN